MKAINLLHNVYNDAWHNYPNSYEAKLASAIRDYKYPNGQPLNITKAVYIASELSDLVTLGQCTIVEFDNVLDTLESLTGYTKQEILDRGRESIMNLLSIIEFLGRKRMVTYEEARTLEVMTQVVKQSAWLHDYELVDGDLLESTEVVYINLEEIAA